MKTNDIVEQARQRFDARLHTAEYRTIHADADHLEALLQMVDVQAGKRYLDLGTGNGYIAFELATRFPAIAVTGLDIAAHSIQVNQELQCAQGLGNLEFRAYDGVRLPFGDASFWGVISRYAFHHFPDAAVAVQELDRVVEPGGFVLIADPMTHDEDSAGFIDRFQQVQPDGHVHFFRRSELEALFGRQGLRTEASFVSTVSYPRELDAAYRQLLGSTPDSVLEKYQVKVGEQAVQITVEVLNVLFRKGL